MRSRVNYTLVAKHNVGIAQHQRSPTLTTHDVILKNAAYVFQEDAILPFPWPFTIIAIILEPEVGVMLLAGIMRHLKSLPLILQNWMKQLSMIQDIQY